MACPLNNFRLMKGDNTGAYSGNLVKLISGDGTFQYDSSKIGSTSVYIEFKSAYGTVYKSSTFTVTNRCKTITLGTVPPFSYTVPPTSP